MNPRFSPIWARAVACGIDWIILTIASTLVQVVLVALTYVFQGLSGGWDALPGFWELAFSDAFWVQVLNAVLYLLFSILYYGFGVARYQTTWGKALFRMKVVRSGTLERITLRRAIGRHLATLLSLLPFGSGYLMAIFHPEKRTLHDLIAGTAVITDEPATVN